MIFEDRAITPGWTGSPDFLGRPSPISPLTSGYMGLFVEFPLGYPLPTGPATRPHKTCIT